MHTPLLSALLLGLLALGDCSLPQQQAGASAEQWLDAQQGEGVASPVTSMALRRLSGQLVDRRQVFYSTRRFDGPALKELPLAKGRVGFAVLDEDDGKFGLVQHRSTLQLQGREGQRYRLWLNNLGNTIYEVITTVDGLDMLNGQPGSLKNRGYVLEPGKNLVIEGLRKSEWEVMAFRLASPDDAHTSNNAVGDSRNPGVIGVTLFELDTPASDHGVPADRPQAFSANTRNGGGYVSPPRYRGQGISTKTVQRCFFISSPSHRSRR